MNFCCYEFVIELLRLVMVFMISLRFDEIL